MFSWHALSGRSRARTHAGTAGGQPRRCAIARCRQRRTATRFVLAALLALLFQNVALAAYVCPVPVAPGHAAHSQAHAVEPTAPMPDCGMAMPEKPTLCEKHCDPDEGAAAEVRVGTVPAPVLAPLRFELASWRQPPPAASGYHNVAASRADPPPMLRFCSLLI